MAKTLQSSNLSSIYDRFVFTGSTRSELYYTNGIGGDDTQITSLELTTIQNTDGETCITTDADQNITLAGDLTVTGNKITFGSGGIIGQEASSSLLAFTGESAYSFTANTGQALELFLRSDAAEDNADQWKLNVADGGQIDWFSYTSGSWVTKLTLTTSGNLTIPGGLTTSGANQFNNTVTVGEDDTGYDVKFYGATSGEYMLWDQNVGLLKLVGGADLQIIGGESGAAVIQLKADEADDNGDSWHIIHQPNNELDFLNNISGGFVEQLALIPNATATNSYARFAGNILVGGNIIQASDGGSTITMDTSDNVTIGNNLKVGGNVIQASDGGNTITMDTSDNVTIAGDLTVTGNNISGSGGSVITFNADDIEFADNIKLNTDASQIFFGVDGDVSFSHLHNVGIILNANTSFTNIVNDTLIIRHQTSGTPANGIGTAIVYSQQTAADNYEYGMELAAIATDVSSGAEDFDFVVSLMTAGATAAERLRLTSNGALQVKALAGQDGTLELHANNSADHADKFRLRVEHKSSASAGSLWIQGNSSGSWSDCIEVQTNGTTKFENHIYLGQDGTSGGIIYGENSTGLQNDAANLWTVNGQRFRVKDISAAGNFTCSMEVLHGYGSDGKFCFYEYPTSGTTLRVGWSMGSDGSDNTDYKLHWDHGSETVAGASKMSLTHTGNLTTAGYIVEGRTVIKVPASAFHGNDDDTTPGLSGSSSIAYIDDSSAVGVQVGDSDGELYAWVDVPLGYTATKVRVYGSDSNNQVEVYTWNVTDGAIGNEISNGELTVADDTNLQYIQYSACDYDNDPTITHDANAAITVGTYVTGSGIPADAYVASINSSTSFELSASTTGGAKTNSTLTFGSNHVGSDTNMLLIKVVVTATNDIVYGAAVTIEPS